MDKTKKMLEKVPDDSLLVSTPFGTLIRFHCPVRCQCIRATPPFLKGDTVQVQGVCFTRQEPLLYLISGKFYSHHNFKILNPLRGKS